MFRIKTALLACLLLVVGFASITNAQSQGLENFGHFVTNSHVGIPPPPGPPGGKAPPISFMFLNSALKEATLAIKTLADLAMKRKEIDPKKALTMLNNLLTTITANEKGLVKVIKERTDGLKLDVDQLKIRVRTIGNSVNKGMFVPAYAALQPIKAVVFKVLELPANAW